ncbi:hypothetical protein [Streptomyces sp. NPDC052036]|uniref:hypothetical protein n=1 Tax=unclassified Streptomyces TaxID=2593676 RepID=UPI0034282CE2
MRSRVATDRKAITELIAAGVTHIVLSLRSPYPRQVARWLADEIITPVRSATAEFRWRDRPPHREDDIVQLSFVLRKLRPHPRWFQA